MTLETIRICAYMSEYIETVYANAYMNDYKIFSFIHTRTCIETAVCTYILMKHCHRDSLYLYTCKWLNKNSLYLLTLE